MSDQLIKQILTSVRRIAVVGASDNPEKASFRVSAWLQEQGYEIVPVNPRLAGKTILGQQVYHSLKDIPGKIDMVDVFRNAEAATEITLEAIAINAKVVWLQLGIVNQQAAELAKNSGLTMIMDRCPKIEIPRLGLEK